MKTCTDCKETKDISEFTLRSYIRNDGGLVHEAKCKSCKVIYVTELRKRKDIKSGVKRRNYGKINIPNKFLSRGLT